MKVERFAECSPWSILQYFWPALSDNGSWKPILVFILSGRLRQVLLYMGNFEWLPSRISVEIPPLNITFVRLLANMFSLTPVHQIELLRPVFHMSDLMWLSARASVETSVTFVTLVRFLSSMYSLMPPYQWTISKALGTETTLIDLDFCCW